jgi:hypothetical protein
MEKTLKSNIKFCKTTIDKWINSKTYFSMQDKKKFISYLLPFINRNDISFKIYGRSHPAEHDEKNDIKVYFLLENADYWKSRCRKHYKHYCQYVENFKDKTISIYLYNHFDKFVETSNYIVIPVIYLQIDYFQKHYNTIKPEIWTPFEQKRFCLFVTRTCTKPAATVLEKMSKIGECRQIKEIEFDILRNKSCYHDTTLLNIFNQFKFICCCENSIANGYITEKIFNVFFARTIPIYYGPGDKCRYFNKDCFIEITDTISDISIKQIKNLNKNEKLYNEFLKIPKINKKFDNENYIQRSQDFINKIRPK